MTFDEWWKGRAHLFPEGWVRAVASDVWLAALESREEWVSVEERLPKFPTHGTEFIVASNTGYITSLHWSGEKWWANESDLKDDYWKPFITHWRPLPAPPSTPSPEESNATK